jgi:glycosyltransferase involved in cell wall biosynthesis
LSDGSALTDDNFKGRASPPGDRIVVKIAFPHCSTGEDAVDEPLTIVLPCYNTERTVRQTVIGILELAVAARQPLRVAIVDDGSIDDTFEVACELARLFPQVEVMRQPFQRGLGPALDRVRRTLGATRVLAHDGTSPVDLTELGRLLREAGDAATIDADRATDEPRGSRRFAAIAALNAQMQRTHRTITSFRWLQLDDRTVPRRQSSPPAAALRNPPRTSITPITPVGPDGLAPGAPASAGM